MLRKTIDMLCEVAAWFVIVSMSFILAATLAAVMGGKL